MSAAQPSAEALRVALAALEAARGAEHWTDARIITLDADPASTRTERDAAHAAWHAARADRIDAEDAAEAILAAYPDATARRAALYAAGVR